MQVLQDHDKVKGCTDTVTKEAVVEKNGAEPKGKTDADGAFPDAEVCRSCLVVYLFCRV